MFVSCHKSCQVFYDVNSYDRINFASIIIAWLVRRCLIHVLLCLQSMSMSLDFSNEAL